LGRGLGKKQKPKKIKKLFEEGEKIFCLKHLKKIEFEIKFEDYDDNNDDELTKSVVEKFYNFSKICFPNVEVINHTYDF